MHPMPPIRENPCMKCQIFIEDWLSQKLSPMNILYGDVSAKRLERVLPDIIPAFVRFLTKITDTQQNNLYDLLRREVMIKISENMFYPPDKSLELDMQKFTWMVLTDLAYFTIPGELEIIQDILTDHCVCKNNTQKQWMGYCLTHLMMNMDEVHKSHTFSCVSLA